ncbi:hypothetical protein [Natrinema thermotolerans]
MNIAGNRAVVVALLLVAMAITGGIVLTGGNGAGGASSSDGDRAGTPSHRDPDAYSEEGDLSSVQRQLAGQLSSQLGQGAISLSEGEREAASQFVDEEYREQLRQYVDVADETGEGADLEREFERAGETQANLSAAVTAYRETKPEYEAAYEDGDEERARERARELEALYRDIDDLGDDAIARYETIENRTDTDMSASIEAVENVSAEIRAEQATVRDQQFEETSLRLTPERETISFREPLVATGELRTTDGDPIANRSIRLDVGNHTERVRTDSAGAFTLEYRPTNESLSTDRLPVEYVPATQSVYLNAETAVNVSITQSEPTVSLNRTTDELSFGNETAVSGAMTVDGVPVDNVTLVVDISGDRIGTVNVTDGAFDDPVAIPASVPAGERELRVELPYEDGERALTAATDAATVTVRERESSVAIAEVSSSERRVTVTGTLATPDGTPVPDEPVRIRIDDLTVGTVTTDEHGAFRTTVSVPDSVDVGETAVAAVYEGRGSSLESSTAEASVAVSSAGPNAPTTAIAVGMIALLAGGGLAWWYRGDDDRPAASGPAVEQWSLAGEPTVGDAPAKPTPDEVESVLERASDQLANGRPDDAVRTGYGAVRRALLARLGNQDALTHWEFYRQCTDADDVDAASLYELTQGYERAAFGPDGLSREDAAAVLERARSLCDLDEPSNGGAPADD